jgi:hypothetical protein
VNNVAKIKNVETDQAGVVYNPTNPDAVHYRYEMNGLDLPIHYTQGGVSDRIGIQGYGAPGAFFNERAKPMPYWKTFPHKHGCIEYFFYFGSDPEHPDDLGGTVEFWLGEGKDAEPYIITKPTTVVIPPNTLHLPGGARKINRTMLGLVVYDAPLWSCYQVPVLPPDFNLEKQVVEKKNRVKKYQSLVNGRDISRAAIYPSHKGKSQVMLHHDMAQNAMAPHVTEINLVYGAGIGWGCGDMMQFPEYQIRSLPHVHDSIETYIFYGTDTKHRKELGGTVEFWIGEGAKAKQLIIDGPTIVLVPPNTVHLPLYIRKVDSPFVVGSILNFPLWSGLYTEIFPPGFKHISNP